MSHFHPVAPDFVRMHASARPNSIALQSAEHDRHFTYLELDFAAARGVTWLRAQRIGVGDRVAVLARNSIDLIVLHLACGRMGAILVALNWRLNPVELMALLDDCSPKLLVGDDCADAVAAEFQPTLRIEAWMEGMAVSDPASGEVVDASQPSLMLYTSGSTGKPKGVLLTEASLFATAVNFAVIGEVSASSIFLVDVPMFHVIGMVTNVRPVLMMGGRVVVSRGFEPKETLRRLADRSLGITHYFCVPQIASMLRELPDFDGRRLRHLKAIFTGGAPHPEDKIRAWLDDGIPMVDGYGMTEAGTLLGMPLDLEVIRAKAGSAGLMPPTVEHRVVRSDGCDVADGEVGELLVRGANLMAGYWLSPQADKQAFDSDGFFHTGDLVRRDSDGFFFVVDRKKDMFISGGENVYPAEVEAALCSHPAVLEASVIGVADERWGEVGHAFVVLGPGAQADADALQKHCTSRIAKFKVPTAVDVLSMLPRTPSGKVAKGELRNLANALRESK